MKLLPWLTSLVTLLFAGAAAPGADWPPTLDANNPVTKSVDGRIVERYIHGPRAAWEYPESANGEWDYPPPQETGPKQQNHNSFYVLTPKEPRAETPLCVVLHSANRTAYDYLGFDCLERNPGERGDFHTVMTKCPPDFYALFLNSTNHEWWGWGQVHPKAAKTPGLVPPAERRALDTIEWVVDHYHIDRNRIYLCGVCMGGCGTLGLGLPHGDVFAAIRAMVPAGTEYAAYRMGGFPAAPGAEASAEERTAWTKQISAVGLPDPPLVEDFSAQNDNWSKTQPALLQAAEAGRFPLILTWGLFGHATFANLVAQYGPCEVGLAFPWMEIRRNEAYPVFTHASTDQRPPWSGASDFDEAGQMNAWFRWKNIRDTPTTFAMELWLAQPKTTHPFTAPETATADLTLRRLQQLKVRPDRAYRWELRRLGQSIGSGRLAADPANLLTIPKVTITSAPVELSLTEEP